MKRRVRKIANFFAFNLLFFALYLNFIHQSKSSIPVVTNSSKQATAAFSGTVIVEPEKTSEPKAVTTVATDPDQTAGDNNVALKLSIN